MNTKDPNTGGSYTRDPQTGELTATEPTTAPQAGKTEAAREAKAEAKPKGRTRNTANEE